MSRSFSEQDLESLRTLTDRLGKNSRIAVPAFVLGIFATLVGAAIAIYYISQLSTDLEAANLELKRTEAVLDDTKRSLEAANEALTEVKAESETPEPALTDAIDKVNQSSQDVAAARRTVTQAAISLPNQPQKQVNSAPPSSLSGEWVDGNGSIYTIRQNGSDFAYRVRYMRNDGKDSGISGTARGTVRGNTVRYNYTDNIRRSLTCRATIAADRQSMVETCTGPDGKALTVTLIRT